MSSATRVRRHRERRTAEGRRRYEFVLTPDEAARTRAFIAREREADAARRNRWPCRPATPEEIALDPRLAQSWPDETWADYIAFARAGWKGLDPAMEDPVIERDRTPSPVYEMDFD